MIDLQVMDRSTEVWFTLPGHLTRHGYIRTSLKPTAYHGTRRYVIADDYGVLFVADERYIERPTSRAILAAEERINAAIVMLAQHTQDPSTSWAAGCISELKDALYELAKPEATDRSV